jgi:hypothetical protein
MARNRPNERYGLVARSGYVNLKLNSNPTAVVIRSQIVAVMVKALKSATPSAVETSAARDGRTVSGLVIVVIVPLCRALLVLQVGARPATQEAEAATCSANRGHGVYKHCTLRLP